MVRMAIVWVSLFAAAAAMAADTPKQEPAAKLEKAPAKADAKTTDAKTLAGISILGNQDSPKSLVIVPWKGSEIGDMPGLSRLLDDAVQPVDREVFMRELSYYEIRQGKQ